MIYEAGYRVRTDDIQLGKQASSGPDRYCNVISRHFGTSVWSARGASRRLVAMLPGYEPGIVPTRAVSGAS